MWKNDSIAPLLSSIKAVLRYWRTLPIFLALAKKDNSEKRGQSLA